MRIKSLRTELTGLLADIAADLDYPEEDEAQIDRALLGESLEAVRGQLEGLAGSAQSGKILREGLKAVICGKPNVGKSSLMNALLGEQRVIVADTPGTTRDIIEDGANIDGIYVRFFDTAGIRQTEDDIEQIGIDRSKGAFNNSDLVLLVLDSSAPLDGEDLEIMRHVGGRPAIALMNKSDLPGRMVPGDVAKALPGAAIIPASVKNGDGIGRLRQEISGLVYQGRATQGGSAALTNARQEDAARRALAEMDDALAAFRSGETLDLVEIPIRAAWEFLGEITGESAAEDIIERVFEKFCLGK
jgi:tRNA modification GTPase